MKVVEIRQMKDADIEKRLLESKKELFNLRFQMVSGQMANTARMKQVRKTIAKLLTIAGERANKTGVSNA